jgi:mannose-6-phosphate isomerase-like protein (cupin superfamily)
MSDEDSAAKPAENPRRSNRVTAYQRWMKEQDIPIHGGYGIFDARTVERRLWDMTGTDAAFVDLVGMEGFSGIQIIEIPPGGTTKPIKHIYQELICILEGNGATQIWTDASEDKKHTFEWGQFSMFSPPINTWYRLFNGGNEPVIYIAVNDCPMMMDLFHNNDFIFNNPYQFSERFSPEDEDYFQLDKRYMEGAGMVWETNLINNVAEALVDAQEMKGAGVKITIFDMCANSFAGHLTEWPVGLYHKAHHHQGGAILLILQATGYSLMWPQEVGVRPYQNGFDDEIVWVDWGPFSIFSPPTKWFHQHMNTSNEIARQLAFRPGGSSKNPTGFRRSGSRMVNGIPGVYVSYREGGTLIEYEDEDPRIMVDFDKELEKNGIKSEMPTFDYNNDVR